MENKEFLENENDLGQEDLQLRQMLRSLESVTAPKDFDFRLKNRLANAQPSKPKSRFAWVYQFALPVLAIGCLITFFAFRNQTQPDLGTTQIPQSFQPKTETTVENKVEIVKTEPTPVETNTTVQNISNRQTPEVPKTIVAQNTPKMITSNNAVKHEKVSGGGSIDFGVKKGNTENPVFSVNSNLQSNIPINKTATFTVREILSQFGVTTESGNGRMVVSSITSNGVGAKAGILVGDIIIALDDQPINPKTTYKDTFAVKSIVVLRNNVRQTIKFKN